MDSHKVYVGCCMVILNPSEDKVLVARRKKEPDMGGFQIPGGTVDYDNGEHLKEAVVREIKEETGLHIPEPEFLCLMNAFHYGKERPVHIAFVGKSDTEELPPNPEPHKAEEWQWVQIDNLPEEKWFRMSRVAVDFFKKRKENPTLPGFVIDEEYVTKS